MNTEKLREEFNQRFFKNFKEILEKCIDSDISGMEYIQKNTIEDIFIFMSEKIHSARKEAQMELLERVEGQIGNKSYYDKNVDYVVKFEDVRAIINEEKTNITQI